MREGWLEWVNPTYSSGAREWIEIFVLQSLVMCKKASYILSHHVRTVGKGLKLSWKLPRPGVLGGGGGGQGKGYLVSLGSLPY